MSFAPRTLSLTSGVDLLRVGSALRPAHAGGVQHLSLAELLRKGACLVHAPGDGVVLVVHVLDPQQAELGALGVHADLLVVVLHLGEGREEDTLVLEAADVLRRVGVEVLKRQQAKQDAKEVFLMILVFMSESSRSCTSSLSLLVIPRTKALSPGGTCCTLPRALS